MRVVPVCLFLDDQESRFPETETQATSRTERTAGSALTSASDKMLKEKLAEAMGIQVQFTPYVML